MGQVILKIKNLTKIYGNRIAVNNISMEIREGEVFGFLGPNGAGKTTTMKMIMGLTKITNGSIEVGGFSVSNKLEKALSLMGGIIENPLFYEYLSGYDNLKYFASLYPGKKISKEKILECAKIVGLEKRIYDKVGKYSLGMKQRLGIAQSLLNDPKLLILDEPLSGLDPNGVKDLRDFLKELAEKRKIAIFISSHMISSIEQICDYIGIINNGELIEVKKLDQIKQGLNETIQLKIKVDYPNYAGKVIIHMLRKRVDVAGNSIIIYTTEDNVNEITKLLINHNISIFGIEIISKSLEDIFIEIINNKTKGVKSIF